MKERFKVIRVTTDGETYETEISGYHASRVVHELFRDYQSDITLYAAVFHRMAIQKFNRDNTFWQCSSEWSRTAVQLAASMKDEAK